MEPYIKVTPASPIKRVKPAYAVVAIDYEGVFSHVGKSNSCGKPGHPGPDDDGVVFQSGFFNGLGPRKTVTGGIKGAYNPSILGIRYFMVLLNVFSSI